MAEQQDKNKKKSAAAAFRMIGLIVLFGVLVFAVARVIVGSSLFQAPDDVLSTDPDGETLYAIAAASVVDVCPYQSGIAVLTDSEMLYFDAGGSITRSAEHSYNVPCMTSYEREILVYDRGDTDYRIEINAAVYGEYTAPSNILTAAIGKNGNYAIATLADGGYQSKLYVYKQDGTLQFEWGSAKNFITSIALSDDGKHFAVALAGSENAVYTSQIQVFEFGAAEAIYIDSFVDTTVLALDFMKKDSLCLVTDTFAAYITDGEVEKLLEYTASSLLSVDVQHGSALTILLSSGYVDDDSPRVFVWDEDADSILSSVSVSQAVQLLSTNKKYIAVADEKHITVYNGSGAFNGEAKTPYNIESITVVDNNVFCLHENGFSVFSVHTHLPEETENAN